MGEANKVSVDIEILNEREAEVAFDRLTGKADKLAGDLGRVSADPFSALAKGAKLTGDAYDELDKAIEESFVKSKRSATSFSEETARGIQSAQRETLSLQRAFQGLTRSPFANIAADSERAAARSFQLQQTLISLYKQQGRGRPLAELEKELDDARLKAERLRADLFRLQSSQVAQGSGGVGGGGGTDGGGVSAFGLRRAIQTGAQAAGLPNIVGGVGGLEAFGGPIAGIGIGIGAIAGLRELIKLDEEARKGEFDLAVAARDTGQSFAAASHDADTFRGALIANRQEAQAVAAAFGQLKLRSGDALPADAAQKLATIATARGFTPDETAKTIAALAKGSKEAFEQLTGRDADLVLDRYARSANTVAFALTDVQRVQILAASATADYAKQVDIAQQRTDSFSGQLQSLKNTASDILSDASLPFLGQLLSGGDLSTLGFRTVATAVRDRAANRPTGASPQEQADAIHDVFVKSFQQSLATSQAQRFADLDRSFRALPENFGAGLTPVERQQTDLARLRSQRKALEEEYEAFQKIKGQFSTDDAKKFDDDFKDRIQGVTDSIRQSLDTLAKESLEKIRATRDGFREFVSGIAQRADRDNPLVAMLVGFNRELEETRKKFAPFGSAFVEQAVRMLKSTQDNELALTQFQLNLSSLRSEQEAQRLSRPFTGLTGPEQRALDVTNARASAATNTPQLLAEALGLSQGRALGSLGDVNAMLAQQAALREQINRESDKGRRSELQRQLREEQKQFERTADQRPLQVLLDQLNGLERLRFERGGALGDSTRDALNAQLLQLTGQIDPRVLATNPFFEGARDLRVRTLREQAGKFERDIRNTEERERAGSFIQKDARELLQEIKSSALTEPQKLKEFLAVTGALSDSELTGDLRRARVDALRESARFDAAKAQEAEARAKTLNDAMVKLNNILTAKGIKLDGDAAKVEIEVIDNSDISRTSVLGKRY